MNIIIEIKKLLEDAQEDFLSKHSKTYDLDKYAEYMDTNFLSGRDNSRRRYDKAIDSYINANFGNIKDKKVLKEIKDKLVNQYEYEDGVN